MILGGKRIPIRNSPSNVSSFFVKTFDLSELLSHGFKSIVKHPDITIMDEPPPTKKTRIINGLTLDPTHDEHEHIKIKIINVADHPVVIPQFLTNNHQVCEIPTDEEVYENDLP